MISVLSMQELCTKNGRELVQSAAAHAWRELLRPGTWRPTNLSVEGRIRYYTLQSLLFCDGRFSSTKSCTAQFSEPTPFWTQNTPYGSYFCLIWYSLS